MFKGKAMKKILSLIMCSIMMLTLVFPNVNLKIFDNTVEAATSSKTLGAGSIGVGANESEAANLPRTNKQDTFRFTTNNYNNSHPALDTNDWASNWLWDLEGDRNSDSTEALSGTAYAFPLSFLMKKDGLRIVKPSMTSNSTNVSAYNIKDNDTLGEFKLSPEWTCTNNNIDQITDWSYEAITTSGSKSMKTIMTQGSPFAFFELTNSNIVYLEKLRVTFPSKIVFEETYNGSKMLVFRTNDITSSVNGYPGLTYQYYAIYLPEGATVDHTGTSDTTGNDGIGRLKITLPSNKTYMSMAWVCESQGHDDNTAIGYAKEYRSYAFNFITDTKADYAYNENSSTLDTTYQYTVSKKAESTADGTIMGILPHQYKNMSGYSYLNNQATTLRGKMKFLKGSSYKTSMTYKGILPYMPSLSESDTAGIAQLKSYVKEAANSDLFVNESAQETYYHGKKLNRAAQIVAAAKSVGDEESANKVLNKLEENLTEWFTYSGTHDKNYFTYLGEGVGVLLGFPTSFNAVDQFNDHHFHYGYFIEAAASVGLYDKEWLNNYKDVVKQLIYDIASPYRNQSDCVADCGNAYPYLRSFSPYEGHSWASGYEDERTGNNQESTSEAINAWAGIILFGEVTGDTEIRDLGIYLYTTEVAAADNYWFNIDKDIYNIENSKYEPPMASMVWGGKVDYATWFGQQYTQGIQICPMQSWSFYLLNGGKDYIKNFYNYDKNSTPAQGGSTSAWNDMWAAYYALADPEYAMNTVWTKQAVNDGESQAHTYHYIQSMINYGTPDLSFKSTSTLGTVFNKDGKYTFAVYNPTSSMETVTFTNNSGYSATIKASPNAMTLVDSSDVGKSTYTVEYYGKDLGSNTYSLIDSAVKYANANERVTTSAKNITGYTYDDSNTNNVLTGTVSSDNSLVLKVYYNRATYSISYNMNGGNKADANLYPASYIYGQTYSLDQPVREGYDFYGWYADAAYEKKVTSITPSTNGGLTLYAKWIPAGTILLSDDIYLSFDGDANGTFTINGSTSYNAINVLYRLVDTESEAAQLVGNKAEEGFVSWGMNSTGNGWTRTENFSANKGRYIVFYFIRYDDRGGYKTDYAYGKIASGGGGTVVTPDPTTASSVETTAPIVSGDWTVVKDSGDKFYYRNADNMSVVSVQKPGFANESGIYITSSMGVGYVTFNGTRVDDSKVAIQGAAAIIYTSALTSEITTVAYYTSDGNKIGSIDIKNTDAEGDVTVPVETTQEQTEPVYVDAFSNIEAEDYNSLSGSGVKDSNASLSGGGNLGGVQNGTCPGYNVNFTKAATMIEMSYASNTNDASGYVEVYIDSTSNSPAATINLSNTGEGWNTYKTISSKINVASGKHTIYLKFITTNGKYYVANVDYFKFTDKVEVTTEAPTEVPTTTAVPTTTEAVNPKPSTPVGLVVTDYMDTYGYFVVAFADVAEAVSYNLYVDGNYVGQITNGGAYHVDELQNGEHYAEITAVNENGESDRSAKAIFVVNKTEETTTEEQTTKYKIVENDNVKVEGYQISATAKDVGGSRVVGSVEPSIDGKKVVSWGMVYAITEIDGNTLNVSDDEVYVGTDNRFVKSYQSTDEGKLDVVMGDSKTATYFVQTTLFSGYTASEMNAKYKVRTYALLEDGSYLYSGIKAYSVYKVADVLYKNAMMNNYSGHQFLYDNILSKVNPNYAEVDYNWAGTIIK